MPQPEPIESPDLRSNAARLQSRGPLANPFTAHRSATDLGTRRTAQRADLGLTEREAEVLDRLAAGLDNAAIATTLCLSEKTVRNYVSMVLAKLHVASRAEAIVKARDAGLGR